MSRMLCPPHPDAATLRLFALGRLCDETRDQVERHLGECRACALGAEAVPGDRLLDLLRRGSPAAVDAETSFSSRGERGTHGPSDLLFPTWASEGRE
ncbi:MAG TPA: hypothetical protein VGH33_22180 [Isosphaeraceae bacterium]